MRANSLRAVALFLAVGVGFAGLTSCSQHSSNFSSDPTPPDQPTPNPTPAESNGPHLYVATNQYVPNGDPSNPESTYGYSVSTDGQLTQINGFPLPYALNGVTSGKYLFAADSDGVHISTYQINSDGSVAKVQSFDDTQASAKACFQCVPGTPQFADPTGSRLYVTAGYLDGGDWNAYLQTFAINPSDGSITYVASDMWIESRGWGQVFGSFSGDGAFLYGTNETTENSMVVFANQAANGSLSEPSNPFPVLNGLAYDPAYSMVVGADTTNHLVVAFQASDANGNPTWPIQLASFTINSDGSLTTTNSNAQMPQAPSYVGTVSPDGTLIAMAGANNGIQLYNFNGANPITALGGALTTDSIRQLAWDSQNHLYALSNSQKVYVFNLTSSGATPAPGSPHSITNAWGLLVQP